MDCLVPREEAVPANSQHQQIASLKNPEAKSGTLIAGQKIQILRTVRVGPALLPAKATKKKLRASASAHVQLLSNQSDASIEPWLQIRKSSNQRQYYNVKRPSVSLDSSREKQAIVVEHIEPDSSETEEDYSNNNFFDSDLDEPPYKKIKNNHSSDDDWEPSSDSSCSSDDDELLEFTGWTDEDEPLTSTKEPPKDIVPDKCLYCEEEFPTIRLAVKHMNATHPEFLQRKCGVCKKKIKTTQQFYCHIQNNHRKKHLRLCPNCGKMCKNKESLNHHLESHIPDSECEFVCSTCSKGFKSSRRLLVHEKTHLPPFQCDFCSKHIRNKKRLIEHMYLHTHNKTYDCGICGASFVRRDNRKTHMKNNHNWICLICFRNFEMKKTVIAHVDSEHSQEDIEKFADSGVTYQKVTRFQCQICFRYLASKQSLEFHLATHEGSNGGKKRPQHSSAVNKKRKTKNIK